MSLPHRWLMRRGRGWCSRRLGGCLERQLHFLIRTWEREQWLRAPGHHEHYAKPGTQNQRRRIAAEAREILS
jgi:ribosomal protein S21